MSRDAYPRDGDESLHLIANALERIEGALEVRVANRGATRPPIGWAILELLGHRREVGHLSEEEVAGRTFLRLATPLWDDERQDWPPSIEGADPAHRVIFISTGAIYAITPTTEQAVRDEIAPWIECKEPVAVQVEGTDEPEARPCTLRRGHGGNHADDDLADLPF